MKRSIRYTYFISVLFFLCMSCFVHVNAQKENSSATVDSLNAQIDSLKQTLNDGSYTRIPNKDFETIINNKIESSLRETVKWWLFVIAALISLLGFLVNKYAKVYLENTVEGKINLLKKENEEIIKTISTKHFSSVNDSIIDFKMENISKKDYIVEEYVVDNLRAYLTDDSIEIVAQKKVDIIDSAMTCYYSNNYPDKTKKMIDLIKKYEEQFTLRPQTYANAAIAFLHKYQYYGTKDFLISTVENCDKSIKADSDYGLSYALKLELYIIAISKAFDDTEKTQFVNELLKVFKDIENNSSPYICIDLLNRFEIDKKSFGSYIDQLYKDYPDEMKKIVTRSTAAA